MDGNDLKELRELVEFLKANGIAEFEMERPDLKVGLKFAGAFASSAFEPSVPSFFTPAVGTVPAVAASAAPAAAAAEPSAEDGAHIVKSPIVGTFYAAPSPDAEPFAKVGDQVSVGKVLCIVEAMKLMNEIESDAAGEIVKVFVKSGQPVEYGQPLFAVK
ncbi:MAG: acetyl-CoA carboxylase biotin carboxyl carrier protein [Acidobacteriota bacterium]